MTAPLEMPTAEHSDIAATLASSIANRIVELLPTIQQQLAVGGPARGLTARVTFRNGSPEAPVVAEVEYTISHGDSERWGLTPNAQTGSLMRMQQQQQPHMTVPQEPAPIFEPQQPAKVPFFRHPGEAGGGAPIGPRGHLSANHGVETEAVPDIMSGVPGAVPNQEQQQALLQTLRALDPQAQQALIQGMSGGTSPAAPSGPVRAQRPQLPGDRDIR